MPDSRLLVAMLITVLGLVLMVKHVYTESDLSDHWKTGWTFLLFFFNAFAAPFYWTLQMANDDPKPRPGDPSGA